MRTSILPVRDRCCFFDFASSDTGLGLDKRLIVHPFCPTLEGKYDGYHGTLPRGALDQEATAHDLGSFLYSPKAKTLPPARDIESRTVVLQVETKLGVGACQLCVEPGGLRVTKRIGED